QDISIGIYGTKTQLTHRSDILAFRIAEIIVEFCQIIFIDPGAVVDIGGNLLKWVWLSLVQNTLQ
ncbi:hypothetical protein GWN15_21820, partial [candidate division KSB1 bacterium]|nr:hypothetical protein [candidate division KSB1 bacterium]NIW71487.1 hypothetical protein [candidate division KSB1 bacterium]